ncbi:MAG TPA: asparagine synthase-related protein [Longimicrobium sp.]|nr:asparagine synthase-related protein [Longimicrobium sp.]
MSGFAGIVAHGGAPVEAALLGRMARLLRRRGPDGHGVLALDGCGFAHALLLTGDRPAPAAAFSLHPSLSIVCDARLDARADLVRALAAAGEDAAPDASAAELILRAYRAWGTACLERLPGDLAFAVWDAPRRRLFCARDPFGVKLLYHAAPRGAFVFSNTADCVLLHPGVDAALDELAIADFLVHSAQVDPRRTLRAGVRALPAGHALVVEEDGRVRTWRWWQPPVDEPLRYRRVADYADRFVELLSTAVRERMPAGPVSVLMSGGRDSTAVAALATEGGAGAVRAFTAVSSRLVREEEGRYAAAAARALGIPVTWLDVDPYRAFARFGSDPLLRRSEPLDAPFLAAEVDQARQAGEHSRVLLTGYGGDAALRESRSRLTRLVLAGHPLRAAAEAAVYARHHRRLPRPGVRAWLRRNDLATPPPMPAWIPAEFARRVELAGGVARLPVPPPHPTRPEAARALAEPLWPFLFASRDPGATGLALELRHPFFDLRLIRFLLSVPPAQWYNDKGLLVAGMRGRLPPTVLHRPKTPLPDDPLAARLRAHGPGWLDGRTLGPEVEPYVDPARVPAVAGGRAPGPGDPLWLNLRPLSLSLWLREHAAAPPVP